MKELFFRLMDRYDPENARLTVEIFQGELTNEFESFGQQVDTELNGICDAVSSIWIRTRRDSFPDFRPAQIAVSKSSIDALMSLQHIIQQELVDGKSQINLQLKLLKDQILTMSDEQFDHEQARISKMYRELDHGIKNKILVDADCLKYCCRPSFEEWNFDEVSFNWLYDSNTYYYISMKPKRGSKTKLGPEGHAFALYTGEENNPFAQAPALVDANTGEVIFDNLGTTRQFMDEYLKIYEELLGDDVVNYYVNIFEIKSREYLNQLEI